MMTPIVYYGNICGNEVYIKRDDLIPFSFGGNKVRIAWEYFEDMEKRGCDCLIGYGNARSNLCRVLANMCSSKGIPCHIVSPADDDGTVVRTPNSIMVGACGAQIHTCQKTNVAETVQGVIDMCRSQGYEPYYIYGDRTGSGNEATPVGAYVKAYGEITAQAEEMGVDFDTVFLSTGTGMTHSGLLAGAAKAGKKQEIIGISVARGADAEKKVLRKYLDAYLEKHGIEDKVNNEITVLDDYLCGGYGKYNEGIEAVVRETFCGHGIPVDTTYVGKGFYGMKRYLEDNAVSGKNILFIHTGGTPLFFDYVEKL